MNKVTTIIGKISDILEEEMKDHPLMFLTKPDNVTRYIYIDNAKIKTQVYITDDEYNTIISLKTKKDYLLNINHKQPVIQTICEMQLKNNNIIIIDRSI